MPIVANDYDIANLALDNIHVTVKIASLNEASEQAKAAKRRYEQVRQAALKAYPWEFAGKRAVLVADTDAAHKNPHWQRAFEVPADLLKPRGFVLEGYRNVPVGWKVPFEISNLPDASGRRIYTDLPADASTPFAYTFDVADVTKYPEHFVDFFAAALAIKIAIPLKINEKVFKSALAILQAAWTDATNDEAGEKVHETPDASWILARG